MIARLFDPLGFLGPILTEAKLILQKLWVLKLEWDESLSNPIAKEWNDFVSTLPVIQNIHFPGLVIGKGRIIIHGFADASTAAYGAVLYAQSISEEDVSTRLLCSKSCVAPVKPITIPRLELCACVLLSKILEKRLTQNCQWNHVSSNENPADLISRGLNASDISSKQLWWHGPDFLREELEANPIDFERITSDSDYLKELKPANVLLTSCKFSLIDDLSKRSNNYTKLLHILSYIFRFLHNSRNPSVKRSGQLDYSEVNEAELCLIKNLQASAFQEEIEFLAKSSCNSKKVKEAVGSLVVRASDSRPEGLGSYARCHQTPSEYTRSTCSLNQRVRSLVGLITSAGTGEYFPPLQSTCRNCGGGDRGRVAIYRPFGEFRRAKSYCHLYGAQGQRQAYLLPMPR
ncbi:integrase catalytic domain-containing protein [Trichonephila clavipes]|nr:integrase catalytic domain-containing protein [Trichonephila clavipes]